MNRWIGVVLSLFFLPAMSIAEGFSLTPSIGLKSFSIENSNSAKSHYESTAFQVDFGIPIIDRRSFDVNFIVHAGYLQFENNSNSDLQRELGNGQYFGGGLQFKFYRFFLAANYNMYTNKHVWSGEENSFQEVKFNAIDLKAGMELSIGKSSYLSIGFSQSNSEIKNDAINGGVKAPYTDKTYWIGFRILTNFGRNSFSKFVTSTGD